MTRVLILSNNRLLRESLARILNKKSDIEVMESQQLNSECNAEILKSGAEIVLLDSVSYLYSHAERIQKLRAGEAGTRVVLIAMDDDEQTFLKAVRGGALGYVLKDASAMDVVAAVRSVAQGEAVCPARMCKMLFEYVARQRGELPGRRTTSRTRLTRREQQLIPLIGRGLTNKEIASHLNLSEQTVKNHVHRILHKMGAESRLSVVEALLPGHLEA